MRFFYVQFGLLERISVTGSNGGVEMAKTKKQKTVRVEFDLPVEYVEYLRSVVRVEGIPQIGESIDELSEWCRNEIMRMFVDKRRTTVALRRVSIYWNTALIDAVVRRAGVGGVATFVRQVVFDALRREGIVNITQMPPWKESRATAAMEAAANGKSGALRKYKSGPDDDGHGSDRFHPIAVPQDWWDAMDANWPGQVSTWIMAQVQNRMQDDMGELYPAKVTMREFLKKWRED